MQVFDLHGNSRKKEKAPDGGKDENVFDIQQGVAVLTCVRSNGFDEITEPAHVYHADLWRLREEKYQCLAKTDVTTTRWTRLHPSAEFYLFVPQAEEIRTETESLWKITDIFTVNNASLVTHHDSFVFDFDGLPLEERIATFRNEGVSDDEIRKRFGLRDSSTWRVFQARQLVKGDATCSDKFTRCLYRPFDIRMLYYHNAVVERPRREVMEHLLSPNIALITTRQVTSLMFCHAFVTSWPVEFKCVSHDRNCNTFPLYLYPDDSISQRKLVVETERRPNINHMFLKALADRLTLTLAPPYHLPNGFTPEDIFFYVYAVLHSPGYRRRYAEFLKIDFPRLPLTCCLELFKSLATLGGELVALHLIEFDVVGVPGVCPEQPGACHAPLQKTYKLLTTCVGAGSPIVEKVSYSDNTVWIDKAKSQGIQGVPENVWNFHIGGYQICEKWLKDRGPKGGKPGRTLSADDITHYHRIVVALNETIRIMAEIDKVIEAHGGWPGAFQDKQKDTAAAYASEPLPLLKAAEESLPYEPAESAKISSKTHVSQKDDWETWLALSQWARQSMSINTCWGEFAIEISHILKAGKQPSDKQKENMTKCWDMAANEGFKV